MIFFLSVKLPSWQIELNLYFLLVGSMYVRSVYVIVSDVLYPPCSALQPKTGRGKEQI